MPKPTLCIDFDGVIHSYTSGWDKERGALAVNDRPVLGAFEWLLNAADHFDLQIYSSRSDQEGGIKAMQDWFGHWAPIEFMGNQPKIYALLSRLHYPTAKPKPFLTIDDRALTFNGNWADPMYEPEQLLKFKPWNKK